MCTQTWTAVHRILALRRPGGHEMNEVEINDEARQKFQYHAKTHPKADHKRETRTTSLLRAPA